MLAIGFECSDDYTWSMEVYGRDPVLVCALLRSKGGGIIPSQILLIKDDEVIEHWNQGRDYDKVSDRSLEFRLDRLFPANE